MTFTVPQGDFQRLSRRPTASARPLVTQASARRPAQLLGTGELVVADNHVDPATATVQTEGRFANPERASCGPASSSTSPDTADPAATPSPCPAAAVNQGPKGLRLLVEADDKAVAASAGGRPPQDDIAVIQSRRRGRARRVVTDGQMSLARAPRSPCAGPRRSGGQDGGKRRSGRAAPT